MKSALSVGGWLEEIVKTFGAPDFDYDKSKNRRTKFGTAEYLDLAGVGSRCIALGVFTAPGSAAECTFGGLEVVYLGVCAPDNHAFSKDLDAKVFDLIENLRTDGSGKELIDTAKP